MSGQAWYRHFWVWFLFLPPVAAMVFWGVIITVFAGPPALVVDDYAKIGLTYEQERERDAAAAELGVAARLRLGRDDGHVSVAVFGLDVPPSALELRLVHPTEAARDRAVELRRVGSGLYRGQVAGDVSGRWRVQLAPPDAAWRLAEVMFAGEQEIELNPPPHLAER